MIFRRIPVRRGELKFLGQVTLCRPSLLGCGQILSVDDGKWYRYRGEECPVLDGEVSLTLCPRTSPYAGAFGTLPLERNTALSRPDLKKRNPTLGDKKWTTDPTSISGSAIVEQIDPVSG